MGWKDYRCSNKLFKEGGIMVIKRKDVNMIIDYIRKTIANSDELSSLVNVDHDYEFDNLIYGISNEYLSDFIEMVTGNKVEVIGEVEELYKCPCCGYNTLNEVYNSDEGTGYDICPLCGWEDDGTTKIDEYRSINKGSITDYRKKLSANNVTNKWLKNK